MAVALLAPPAMATSSAARSVSAVQKVIELLTDMSASAKKMMHEEEVGFSEFSTFCSDTTASKEREISKGKQLVESLSAEIGKLEADSTELAGKIRELEQGLTKGEQDLKEATEQRKKDHVSYTEQIQDFGDSTDALDRAIAVLQKQNYDRAQASEALLQLSSSSQLPQEVRRSLAAFVELQRGDGDFISRSAPEAKGYEFQSSTIVDLLKKLRDEFKTKRTEVEKEEINSRHAFEMMSQDLHDFIRNSEADVADKTAVLQGKKKSAAQKKQQLVLAESDLSEDEQFHKELKVECAEKQESFAEKQKLRADELEVIQKAVEILSSPEVLGSAQAHLPELMQKSSGTALAQLRGEATEPQGVRKTLSAFLRRESRRLRSQQLDMLAVRVSSSDPFAKVKKLIDDMITRLLNEANEESEQKGWCDKELGTNKLTRVKLQEGIDGLTATIDETEAAITQGAERISMLEKELVELRTTQKESSELRAAEKAKNEATAKDAAEALMAIRSATAILKDFYARSSGATALLQLTAKQEPVAMGSEEWQSLANTSFEGELDRGHKAGMQTFGATYTGQQDEAGGVLAMLEVIEGDFVALEASTNSAEEEAIRAFKSFTTVTEKSIAVKEKESQMLTNDKAQAEADLATAKKDLAGTQDQLLAADRYYDKLKPSCVDHGLSYEERAKARQEEMESLQEALKILSGEDLS
eukprot:CAMPEP_0170600038 /NCGR_PEP_ID=MMETSP0224-20130122/17125_1 /TAXON_ID=285029 /ORGANISM="Togula jolla, Strain CCCM 725" /LENGTH=699 /DNA_ID=CAMNT_0010924745 /DNA_START=75 /DNA_END=2171 /DNA_ORIENTATION=+